MPKKKKKILKKKRKNSTFIVQFKVNVTIERITAGLMQDNHDKEQKGKLPGYTHHLDWRESSGRESSGILVYHQPLTVLYHPC